MSGAIGALGIQGPTGPVGLQGPVGLPGGPTHIVHHKVKNYDVFEIPVARVHEFCTDTHRSIPSFSPDFLDWIDQHGYRGAIHMDMNRRIVITDANAALEFKLCFY